MSDNVNGHSTGGGKAPGAGVTVGSAGIAGYRISHHADVNGRHCIRSGDYVTGPESADGTRCPNGCEGATLTQVALYPYVAEVREVITYRIPVLSEGIFVAEDQADMIYRTEPPNEYATGKSVSITVSPAPSDDGRAPGDGAEGREAGS